jgi:cytochrome c oxidase assembly protein subunit 15
MKTEERHAAHALAIRRWLWFVAFLVFAMVAVGGATRLTDSGLSITEWQPLIGTIPPLSDAAWQAAFDLYKQTSEFKLQNSAMTLGEFKFIYWWEWAHRLLGRFIGVAFALPFLIFLALRAIPAKLAWRLAAILLLGAAQGALGWYMVRSGLVDRVDVSQYRLAAHLTLATLIFAALVWTALGIGRERRWQGAAGPWGGLLILVLIFLQIAAGGFVAGLDAGHAANTWPTIDGQFIPDGIYSVSPWWANLFEDALTVQFNHRMLGYLIAILAIAHVWNVGAGSGLGLLYALLIQIGIGIGTVVLGVPLALALLHQAGAMIVLFAALYSLDRLLTRSPAPNPR